MIGWVDASAGASGDMLLGALLDAGASLDAVRTAVAAVGVEPIAIRAEPVHRAGLRALRAHVDTGGVPSDGVPSDGVPSDGVPSDGVPSDGVPSDGVPSDRPERADHAPPRRTWADVRDLLAAADLPERVRERATAVFAALAEAEAHVHGVSPDEVHFHEVGALDAIADVVGVCAAVVDLGIEELTCSTVTVGWGTVPTAHGPLPVPAPAVVELLRRAGLPSRGGDVPHEACTPTGAALLAVLAGGCGPQPPMTVTAVGVGAGGRDPDGAPPNVVRVLLGTPTPLPLAECGVVAANSAEIAATTPHSAGGGAAGDGWQVVVETNVDDLDPRLWPGVLAALLSAGAADAWLTPILMKKGRPAHTLHVLCGHDVAPEMRRIVVTHTSAIGVREHLVAKHALPRRIETVEVRGHPVRVKLSSDDDTVVTAQPEYDDVAAAAAALGISERTVLAEAAAAAEVLRAADSSETTALSATDASGTTDRGAVP